VPREGDIAQTVTREGHGAGPATEGTTRARRPISLLGKILALVIIVPLVIVAISVGFWDFLFGQIIGVLERLH
jgi:hypothetical protein